MSGERKHVLVAGGGISGLTAAYYIQKYAADKGMGVDITMVEASGEFGGKIRTIRRERFVIERGPDSFLARKLPILDLTRDLGLEQELVATNPQAQKTYILHHGKLHRMPPGLVLGIPTQLGPFVKSGLVSPLGKARAALDLVLPRRSEDGDESLGGFLQRRLGSEVLAHIAEPLLAGIYAGDTHKLSLQATFPQFQEAERQNRSLILGMLKNKRGASSPVRPDMLPAVAKRSMFLSYRKGLATLVEALLAALRSTRKLSGLSVESMARLDQGYSLKLSDGTQLEADAVVLATPAFAAAKVLADTPGTGYLAEIPYVSVANVVLVFNEADINVQLDGSGFLIPRSEGRMLTAVTWTSAKWLHTAPQGKAVLRCYIGRAGSEVGEELTDQSMVARVKTEIREMMGIAADPISVDVTRWKHSMPQYPVGHLDRLKELEANMEAALPGVLLTGSGYRGVGIPDCIGQARRAAEKMIAFLEKADKVSARRS